MPDTAVTVRGLRKLFGARAALDGVDLEVPAGSVFGLVGPNGAGKTTLLRCLLGLARPTSGSMTVLGGQLPMAHANVLSSTGALIEEPKFHRFLTGRENLSAVARLRGAQAVARIPGLLARVDLADRADDKVGAYSLGMRQRLAMARSLLGDPQLLVLDEPANGLDPEGIRQTRELLGSCRDEGRTVLVSSHQLGELEKICDQVALIDAGKVIHTGPLGATDAARLVIRCSDPPAATTILVALAGVESAAPSDGQVVVELAELTDTMRSMTVRALIEAGIDVTGVEVKQGESLEDLYMRLRGSGAPS